jgi:hypothetical protein
MSDCKAFMREIDEAANGRKPCGAALAHAALCRSCGERLREHESLRSLVKGLGRVEAPADFEFRLRARMASARGESRRGPFGGLRFVYRLAPVAAALCFLLVSASLYVWQSSRTKPAARQQGAVEVAHSAVDANKGQGAQAPSAIQVTNPPNGVVQDGAAGLSSLSSHQSQAVVRRQFVAARRVKTPAQKVAGAGAEAASNVLSLNSAEVIRSRTLTIPLETASAPLRLVLRDERGAERVVPMRAVSFGAQDVIARDAARRQTAEAEQGGVW